MSKMPFSLIAWKTKIQTGSGIKNDGTIRHSLELPIADQLELKAKRYRRQHMVTTQQEIQYAMADLESAHLLMLWIPYDCLHKAEKIVITLLLDMQ